MITPHLLLFTLITLCVYKPWVSPESWSVNSSMYVDVVCIRAVRLIEIEIAIWTCAISKSLYSTIFFCVVCYPNQSECSRTEQTGHSDRQCAKETGKMSSEQDKDLVAKKNACRMQSTRSRERSDHISFRAESVFLKIALRSLIRSAPLAQHKMPFGNLLIPESVE